MAKSRIEVGYLSGGRQVFGVGQTSGRERFIEGGPTAADVREMERELAERRAADGQWLHGVPPLLRGLLKRGGVPSRDVKRRRKGVSS